MNFLFLVQQATISSGGGAAVGFGIVGVFFLLLGLLSFVFWIWMIVDCATNKSLEGTEKIVWLLVVIFLHALGALIYFFAGRKKAG